MIEIRSDFECGNAKNVISLGEDHLRLEVVGDKPTYCYYFCFDVINRGPAATVTIEVWHDPLINDAQGFISHFPTTIWVQPQGWQRYKARHEDHCETHADHLVLRMPIEENQTLRVTDMWPAPYSETTAYLQGLAQERGDRCALFSIGRTVQGREIVGLRAGTLGKPRVLCIAGQHPIEFSGTWAMRAIADYVSSLTPEAVALRERAEIEVIPLVNPDGTVLGRNGYNAENLDMYRAFGATPDADEPEAHESKLLWRWATARPLALWMNVHNYLGWRDGSEYPFDGWYEVPSAAFSDARQARLNQALCDTMRLETDGPSSNPGHGLHEPYSICHQLAARYGVPSVFYEINGATGGAFRSGKRGLHVFRRAMDTLLKAISAG